MEGRVRTPLNSTRVPVPSGWSVGDFAPPTPPPAAFSPAGDVRAAAWCPVHLFIRACGQSADQRGRAARAGVAAAKPLGIVSPTPDRLLFSLQGGGGKRGF